MLSTSEAQVGWRWRSCPWRADLTEKTMLIGFAVRLVLGAVSMTYHAAFLLSMVFGYGGLFPWGFVTCRNGNHA